MEGEMELEKAQLALKQSKLPIGYHENIVCKVDKLTVANIRHSDKRLLP